MADIVTSRIFQDGEKNITATKMNDIVASSVIQPAFVGSKPSASTVAPTDNLLVLTAAGNTYARAPFQTVIDSVNANLNTNAAIWSVRLRSFQALGNNTFEVDQRNAAGVLVSPASGAFIQDRWQYAKVGTSASSVGQISSASGINLPGTSFAITGRALRVTLTTAQASLAAGDQLFIQQYVEGPQWRELQNDVHSFQILVRTSVAGLSFGIALRDSPATKSLTNILTIPNANTWTLLTLPNLPVWPAGNFVTTPGSVGYLLNITLAAGSTFTSPANSTWQNGNFVGATGQSNFAASPVNSTFDIAYISHEPGALCSNPPMDCPFTQNLDNCLRYFCKSYDYDVLPGTVTNLGDLSWWQQTTTTFKNSIRFPKALAKIPTVTHYNTSTGAANSIFFGGTSYAVSSISNLGKGGFDGIVTATLPAVTAGATALGHYTADGGF
jgi:hypothetical protein